MKFERGKNLTVKQVAEILNVASSTIRGWVDVGSIPVHKYGNNKRSILRFDPDELNEWYNNTIRNKTKKVDIDMLVDSEISLKYDKGNTLESYETFLVNLQKNKMEN